MKLPMLDSGQHTICIAVLVSLFFWGIQLESTIMLVAFTVLAWWYVLLWLVVWKKDILSRERMRLFLYYTKHRGIALLFVWLFWMILTGTYNAFVFVVVGVWASLLRLHWSTVRKGDIYRGEQMIGRDDRILLATLLVMVSLPRLLRYLPTHQIYVISATYGIVVFSLGHVRGNQRAKDFFGLMSFWGLVIVRGVAVGWFLMKERMNVLEHRIVEKEVVVERVQYVPMEFWTGDIIPFVKPTEGRSRVSK